MSRRYSFDDPEDPGERAPLDNPNNTDSYSNAPTSRQQYQDAPSSSSPRRRSHHPGAHPDSVFHHSRRPTQDSRPPSYVSNAAPDQEFAPVPPPHRSTRRSSTTRSSNRRSHASRDRDSVSTTGGYRHSTASNITPGADNFGPVAAGGMSGLALGIADRNARQSGLDAMNHPYPQAHQRPQDSPYDAHPYDAHPYDAPPDPSYYHGGHSGSSSSQSVGAVGGAAAAGFSGRNTPTRSTYSYSSDPFRDPGMAYQNRADPALGQFNPNDIDDDGDDGLEYRRPNRSSVMGLGAGGLMGSNRNSGANYNPVNNSSSGYAGAGGEAGLGGSREKAAYSAGKSASTKKRNRLIIIAVVAVVIIAAVVGGVVGGVLRNGSAGGGSGGGGLSASQDREQNGDLNINSAEIKELMNNPNLHKVFPGVDYTPINVQYPDCLHNPPSQNNVTRDVAVLSQLTDTIRLYGTDCNQTQMTIHALKQLEMVDDMKIWMGVWQDNNKTTNARQLNQMWSILDEYGDSWFKGLIVANEIIFREQMTARELGDLMADVRKNLTAHNWGHLPVATSDLGDSWRKGIAPYSDLIMSNIHPFFGGVPADQGAGWAYEFWMNQNKQFFKADKQDNIIAEIGWPSQGGTDCGEEKTCEVGAVASIDGINTLLEGWVCPALTNNTNYFWFELFDEPWKIQFDTKTEAWEDHWGLMDVNRKLKPGIKIPDCGGKTIDNR